MSSLIEDLPEIDQTYLKKLSNENSTLNFNTGFAVNCLDKIMHHQDSHEVRERMKNRQEDGSNTKDRLSKFAKLSASNHVKAGTNSMVKGTFELMKERCLEKEWELK